MDNAAKRESEMSERSNILEAARERYEIAVRERERTERECPEFIELAIEDEDEARHALQNAESEEDAK